MKTVTLIGHMKTLVIFVFLGYSIIYGLSPDDNTSFDKTAWILITAVFVVNVVLELLQIKSDTTYVVIASYYDDNKIVYAGTSFKKSNHIFDEYNDKPEWYLSFWKYKKGTDGTLLRERHIPSIKR